MGLFIYGVMMIRNDIERIVAPIIEELGFELWGCEFMPHKNSALLRIYIDHSNGIGIDNCEQVSHRLSHVLEVEDVLPTNYRLEISSPGIARILFYPTQYPRFVGHEIQVKLYQAIENQKHLKGILEVVNSDGIQLKVGNRDLVILFSQIAKANLTGK
jgi:ribosome maturation factor RimP